MANGELPFADDVQQKKLNLYPQEGGRVGDDKLEHCSAFDSPPHGLLEKRPEAVS